MALKDYVVKRIRRDAASLITSIEERHFSPLEALVLDIATAIEKAVAPRASEKELVVTVSVPPGTGIALDTLTEALDARLKAFPPPGVWRQLTLIVQPTPPTYRSAGCQLIDAFNGSSARASRAARTPSDSPRARGDAFTPADARRRAHVGQPLRPAGPTKPPRTERAPGERAHEDGDSTGR